MTLLTSMSPMNAMPDYPGIALSYLELARTLADRDAAKPWTGDPAGASASNSLSKTIHAAIDSDQRLVTQEN